jgi:RND family efflux transporter MFP subunit
VAKVYVKNGMYVRKGQKLAELDLFKLNNTLTQNKNALAQANLEMQDVLIGQGYAPDNLSAVPAEKLELAKVKSGYERAKAQYEASLYDVEQATLIAPFDGVVANLFDKQYNMPKSGEPFCRIIRTSAMEVDFTVLESELPLIKVGDQVEVTPYATAVGTRTGNVSEINPLVDENGMVRVKAQVNGGEKLFDGMNVRISVKRSVPDQMVVPRTAIVLRAGKQVIFTVKDSIAMWNYVQTGLENLSEYTLVNWEASGLQEGMTVITTGNVNLAHETPVKIIEK